MRARASQSKASLAYTDDQKLIALRDPIDRLISAFNWRKLLVCKVNQTSDNNMVMSDSPRCYLNSHINAQGELDALMHYNSSNNLLAALCSADEVPQPRLGRPSS